MIESNCRIGRSYPVPTSLPMQAAAIDRSSGGAGSLGTLSNWSPRRVGWREESRQREALVNRSNDLFANDGHAAAIFDATATSSVGSGLTPRSMPNHKRLGISEDQAQDLAEQFEWEFRQFSREADATGWGTLGDVQLLAMYSTPVNGEFLALPLMLKDPGRRYSLALQILDPMRLRTPLSLRGEQNVRDGIRLGHRGEPLSYLIADPEDGLLTSSLDLRDFKEYPIRRAHRPVVLHRFIKKAAEQVRGIPLLAPAMKAFRDLGDYLDYEVVGAIAAAAIAVWIEKTNPYDANSLPNSFGQVQASGKTAYHHEVAPGTVAYGNPGEKPHILKSDRPGSNFGEFVETFQRLTGAVAGLPYEVVTKDFSKTNYSSARAALMEAWKVFQLYQDWLVRHFCQPVYEMVLEEAFVRGYIKLPKNAPDFYSARAEYCNALWLGPRRGSVDPVKEVTAAILAKKNNMGTDADWFAQQGQDWEEQYRQRGRELKLAHSLDLPEEAGAGKGTVNKEPEPAQSGPTDDGALFKAALEMAAEGDDA